MDKNLVSALSALPTNMVEVMSFYFGLEDGVKRSIEETAEKFRMDIGQAHRSIMKALSIMQNPENRFKTNYTKLCDGNKNRYLLLQPINSSEQVLIKKLENGRWQIVSGRAKPSRTGQLWVYDINNPDMPDFFQIDN